MARVDELRLITKIAWLYYERGLRQSEIADRLNLSQATISRFLKRAREEQIARITVNVPLGIHTDLEEALQAKYELKEAVVVDCVEDEEDTIVRNIGRAAAFYLETTIGQDEVVGMGSSRGPTMLAVLESLHPRRAPNGAQFVQILGHVGNPAEMAAGTPLIRRLATLLGGSVTLLPAPALVDSPDARQVFLEDPFVCKAFRMFERLTLALVVISSGDRSILRTIVGDVVSPEEVQRARRLGVVGSICLRPYDISGAPVVTSLDEKIIGITLEQLRNINRVVGIAGGKRKLAGIRGALAGGWVNVLITDCFTAERLVLEDDPTNGLVSDSSVEALTTAR